MSQDAKKEGLIHRSYQVLFIIYAPIALISIFLKFFSDQYSNYLFIFALLASVASLVIAIVMWVLFWQNRQLIEQERSANLPYLIRHQFILLYLPIAFSAMGLSAFFVYDKYVKIVEQQTLEAPTNITLLLPIKTPLGQALADTQQLKQGLGAYFLNTAELSERYHFDILDHNNLYSQEFELSLKARLQRGTKYIVCAYSDVCKQVGENMPHLSEEIGLEIPPIIIATLSSAMDLPLAKNQFYRFHPRSQEDTASLAKYAFEHELKNISILASDDDYGRDAANTLTQAWEGFGGELVHTIYLDPQLTEEVSNDHILESELADTEKSADTGKDIDAIFVALYQPANKALAQLSQNKQLLFSANYQQENIIAIVEQGGKADNITISQPDLKAYNSQTKHVAAMFLYASLELLISN